MLAAIQIFIKSVECGSFSKAGDALGMSPSSVSRHINKLEQDLAIKLFKRSTRHLILTDSGQAFLETAAKLVSDLETALQAIRPLSHEIAGDLRISAVESFGRVRVCPAIPSFLQRHPKIKLELLLDNHLADLYKDNIDLAIRIGRPEDSRLIARKLVENRMIVCASPAYLAQHGTPNAPQALSEHNCLVLGRSRSVAWWHFRQANALEKVQVKGNLTSIGGTPLLEAGLQGVGIMMLAEWILAPHLEAGTLVRILEPWESNLYEGNNADVYAIYLNDPNTKPAIRSFIDHLLAAL